MSPEASSGIAVALMYRLANLLAAHAMVMCVANLQKPHVPEIESAAPDIVSALISAQLPGFFC